MKVLLYVALVVLIAILVLLWKLGQVIAYMLSQTKQVDANEISSELQTLRDNIENIDIKELSSDLEQIATIVQQTDFDNIQTQIDSLNSQLESYSSAIDRVNKVSNFCDGSHQVCPPQVCSPFGGGCYQPPCVNVSNCG